MKKSIFIAATAGAIALSGSISTSQPLEASAKSKVSAATKMSGTYIVKAKKNVYFRANKKKVRSIARKTVVKLTHKRTVNGKLWYKISYGNKKGWVLATNLSKLTRSPITSHVKKYKTAATKNVYSAAGGHSKKIGQIRKSSIVSASQKRTVNGKLWYKVKASNGFTGWVLASNLKSYVKHVSNGGSQIVAEGSKYLGVPYVWGGTTTSGFDCSGFTSYVYKKATGKTIPRTSRAQYAASKKVSRANLKAGDLVFFSATGGTVTHVALYAGNGKLLHAAGNRVHYQNLAGYWDRLVVGYGTF